MGTKTVMELAKITPQSILQKAILNQRVAHAYLFYGPEIDHQLQVALWFAQSLNCDAFTKKNEPCGICSSCQKIVRRMHPDVVLWVPQGALRVIRIDQVRKMQEEVFLKPFEGKVKVHIIQEADCFHLTAANAFLKILEEPPQKTFFILLTTEPESLLPTVRSRCQGLQFKGEPEEFTLNEFPECDRDLSLLEALKEFSSGSLKQARTLIQEGLWEREKSLLQAFETAVTGKTLMSVFGEAERIASIIEEDLEVLELKARKSEDKPDDPIRAKKFEEELKAYLSGEHKRRVNSFLRVVLAWGRVFNQTEKRYRSLPHWLNAVGEALRFLERGANLRWILEILFLKLKVESSS